MLLRALLQGSTHPLSGTIFCLFAWLGAMQVNHLTAAETEPPADALTAVQQSTSSADRPVSAVLDLQHALPAKTEDFKKSDESKDKAEKKSKKTAAKSPVTLETQGADI